MSRSQTRMVIRLAATRSKRTAGSCKNEFGSIRSPARIWYSFWNQSALPADATREDAAPKVLLCVVGGDSGRVGRCQSALFRHAAWAVVQNLHPQRLNCHSNALRDHIPGTLVQGAAAVRQALIDVGFEALRWMKEFVTPHGLGRRRGPDHTQTWVAMLGHSACPQCGPGCPTSHGHCCGPVWFTCCPLARQSSFEAQVFRVLLLRRLWLSSFPRPAMFAGVAVHLIPAGHHRASAAARVCRKAGGPLVVPMWMVLFWRKPREHRFLGGPCVGLTTWCSWPRRRHVPRVMRVSAQRAWLRRWKCRLDCSAAQVFALSLLEHRDAWVQAGWHNPRQTRLVIVVTGSDEDMTDFVSSFISCVPEKKIFFLKKKPDQNISTDFFSCFSLSLFQFIRRCATRTRFGSPVAILAQAISVETRC